MKVCEFWLKIKIDEKQFAQFCTNYSKIGKIWGRHDNPVDENGDPIQATCVYVISLNNNTGWVQLLIDDNTPPAMLTLIENAINMMKDETPFRSYSEEINEITPMEKPKSVAET